MFVTEESCAWNRSSLSERLAGESSKYISPRGKDEPALMLNLDSWVLEVYRTVIATLQSTAWMLLVFFAVALFAYIIVRLSARSGHTAAVA
jgi:hypothetical protein